MQSGKLSLHAVGCSAVFLFCELISRPWVEKGMYDDWSYIYTSRLLAQTGHIHYVGWASAIVGWQFFLGAAFLKLFSFSFTAARIPTLLIALATVYLMQRTLVRFGIGEDNAVLGSLTLALSPLFLQLSATMMTDVPGFFSILACLYGCVRALQAERDRDAILWLGAAVAVDAACGTSRQICWLGVLVVVPCTLWLLRHRRTVLLYGFGINVLGYAFVFAAQHWFNMQPYALPEPAIFAPLHWWAWKRVCLNYAKCFSEMGLLLFPVWLPYVAAVRRFSVRQFAGMAGLAAFFFLWVFHFGEGAALLKLLHPFNGDNLGPRWLFESTALLAQPAESFVAVMLHLMGGLLVGGILCMGAVVLIARPRVIEPQPAGQFSWPQLGTLFVPFLLFYFMLLSSRGTWGIYVRYLFAPMFLCIVCALLYAQQRLQAGRPFAMYAGVAILAFYGVTQTHNLFAQEQARLMLANEVLASGLPPHQIDLGWEMNGWYELQSSSYINEPRIVRPAGAYHRIPYLILGECHQNDPRFGLFLHLAPRYGIVADNPNACAGATAFAPVSYRTWPLLRFETFYVVRYAPPWKVESEYEEPAAN